MANNVTVPVNVWWSPDRPDRIGLGIAKHHPGSAKNPQVYVKRGDPSFEQWANILRYEGKPAPAAEQPAA